MLDCSPASRLRFQTNLYLSQFPDGNVIISLVYCVSLLCAFSSYDFCLTCRWTMCVPFQSVAIARALAASQSGNRNQRFTRYNESLKYSCMCEYWIRRRRISTEHPKKKNHITKQRKKKIFANSRMPSEKKLEFTQFKKKKNVFFFASCIWLMSP